MIEPTPMDLNLGRQPLGPAAGRAALGFGLQMVLPLPTPPTSPRPVPGAA